MEGESKLTGKVIVHYLKHLKDLYCHQYPTGVLLVPLVLLLVVYVALVTLRVL